MIENLIVKGWRSFQHLEIHNLGRVNLLVGENNSGKTSLLEAIQIIASGVDPQVLWSIAARRGELFVEDPEVSYRRSAEIDVSHWYYGFDFGLGSSFSLAAHHALVSETCDFNVVEASPDTQKRLFSTSTRTMPSASPPGSWQADPGVESEDLIAAPLLALQLDFPDPTFQRTYPLTGRGGLLVDSMRSRSVDAGVTRRDVRFVPTAGLSMASLVEMVDDLTLTDEENLTLQAMQMLDDRIERFAPKGRDRRPRIMVRLKGTNKPLPIGSLGDGVHRLLTIAVALAKSANGILLIDEIDTGLHFTTMDRMWKFVNDAAEKLNVQVFATTHSRDCYESLAVICHEAPESSSRVSIQRVETGSQMTVGYTESEIVAAARRGLEVR